MNSKLSRMLSLVITATAATIAVTSALMYTSSEEIFQKKEIFYLLVIITITVMITTALLQIVYTTNRNPFSITLSLLGFPEVGKTVFLTMLFEELQKMQGNHVNFSPYGSETIERIMNDVSTLRNNEWLPRTSMNQVFYYRAFATLNSLPPILRAKKKFKIEIADYAGEHIDQFNPQKENWLHKTEYFQYALQSDAVFLALDTDKFLRDKEFYQRDIDGLIAAIQILAEKKGAFHGEKAEEPIAILFLKSDLLDGGEKEDSVLRETDRLISICRNRFQSVQHFFVSSTGELRDGELTSKLEPTNVVEPLLWLLSKSRVN